MNQLIPGKLYKIKSNHKHDWYINRFNGLYPTQVVSNTDNLPKTLLYLSSSKEELYKMYSSAEEKFAVRMIYNFLVEGKVLKLYNQDTLKQNNNLNKFMHDWKPV